MRYRFYFGLLLIFFLVNTNLFAQNFWVPDSNFRNVLKQLYPSCFTAQDSLNTTCSLVQSNTYLYVGNSNISSLNGIGYFTSLRILICPQNNLTSLPALPATLTYLDCQENQLTSLPALPTTLIQLYCDDNQMTSLPALPLSLYYLDCSNNQLTSLTALPATLELLYCQNNQFVSLPALPATLIQLFCNNNQLTSLPALPASLEDLNCGSNQLTSLPPLPATLTWLDCRANQLTSLPALPSTLTTLYCPQNQLISLPALPATLTGLFCYYNQLTSLPSIPGKTKFFNCSNNPITCFPTIVPRSPGYFPWHLIDIKNTSIPCIPNQNTFPLSVVQTSQPLPFCSPANSTCNYNFTAGYVFMDVNGDGIKDSLENGLPIPVYYSGNYGSWPDSSGFFNSISNTGNITFELNTPAYYTSTTPSSQTIHVAPGSVDTLYFGLQPIPNINDLNVDLTSITFLRPGFKAKYKIHYQNVGTEIISNVNVKFLKPSQLSNLSAFPTANTSNGDTLIWNIASLNPFQQGDIVITDSVFVNATLGDTANASAWIEPIIADTSSQNNVSKSTTIIRGSFDPNDKAVSPEVVLPNATGYLEYIIRFQNTGTDTAFAVMVIDSLSSLLDISSMEMISASHSYDLWIENGVAKWNFINILLPDSNTNELESHGFVKFSIKPLPGLMVTDSIPNAANIYFDYNTAVTTNTIVVNVLNTTQVNDLQEIALQVFPNPVQESIRIVNQHAGALGKIELINASGKVLETKTISTSTYTWNIQHLPAGTYILKGQGWGQKLVKE
ncbi:MAG: T9SS type A sorting domain-containing protein [Bacteroidetes bacterium]|nr:T9SS type A sorting domain-containing protein [Bacteroidota bacterium]